MQYLPQIQGICIVCESPESSGAARRASAVLAAIALALACSVAVPATALASWEDHADTSWYGGSGTYYITSANQLAGLAKIVNDGRQVMCVGETFILVNDIDLSADEWEPIGSAIASSTSYARFGGTFDGAGHSIIGLTITGSGICKGLFGFTEGGQIKNLSVYGDVSAFHDAAGVAAQADGTSFAYVKNYVNVTTYSSTIASQGGILGRCADSDERGAAYNVEMYRCENYGTMYAQNAGNGVGGLVGDAYVAGGYHFYIIECANHGNIVVASGREYGAPSQIVGVGGIMGSTASYGTYLVERCYNEGSITTGDVYCSTGGIVGHMGGAGSNVLYSYNTGDVSGGGNATGGVAGEFASDGAIACTYNKGTVSGSLSGAIAGANAGGAVNNYYLDGTSSQAFASSANAAGEGQAVSSDDLRTQSRLDDLNGNATVTHFAIDSSKNDGHPVLSWQGVSIPGNGGTGGEGEGGAGEGEEGSGAGASDSNGEGGTGIVAAAGDSNDSGGADAAVTAEKKDDPAVEPASEAVAEASQAEAGGESEGSKASYQLLEIAGIDEPEEIIVDDHPMWFNLLCGGIVLAVLLWGIAYRFFDFYTQLGRRYTQAVTTGKSKEATEGAAAAA